MRATCSGLACPPEVGVLDAARSQRGKSQRCRLRQEAIPRPIPARTKSSARVMLDAELTAILGRTIHDHRLCRLLRPWARQACTRANHLGRRRRCSAAKCCGRAARCIRVSSIQRPSLHKHARTHIVSHTIDRSICTCMHTCMHIYLRPRAIHSDQIRVDCAMTNLNRTSSFTL